MSPAEIRLATDSAYHRGLLDGVVGSVGVVAGCYLLTHLFLLIKRRIRMSAIQDLEAAVAAQTPIVTRAVQILNTPNASEAAIIAVKDVILANNAALQAAVDANAPATPTP